MDLKNYEDVLSMAGDESQRQKINLILQAAGNHADAEVPDPYFGGMDGFEKVYKMLDEACETIANDLKSNS